MSFAAFFILGNTSASAATIPVTGSCTIAQAINSVNAGSNQGTCVGSGSYGTNDTINIPTGTHTLTADLPTITESVTIQGAGMGQTTVNGDGQYTSFFAEDVSSVEFLGLTITAMSNAAILTQNASANFEDIEIDGRGGTDRADGINIRVGDGNSYTVTSNNVYIHHLEATGSQDIVNGFMVSADDSSTIDVTITNSTIAYLRNDYGGVFAFSMGAGVGSSSTGGSLDALIDNTTIHSLVSVEVASGFSTAAGADGGNTDINTEVNNITITGIRGEDGLGPFAGMKSAAYYVVVFTTDNGGDVVANTTVSNSLMADNFSDGVSSNCSSADVSSFLGGAGTVDFGITSGGYNVSDDASCTSFTQPTDQQNVGNILSTLGPLQMNGGAVPTRALLPGSPAISAGGAVLGVTTDARGVARPFANPSVGAYQYVLGDETENPVGGNAQNGAGQLSETGANSMSTIVLAFIILISSIMMIQKQRREY